MLQSFFLLTPFSAFGSRGVFMRVRNEENVRTRLTCRPLGTCLTCRNDELSKSHLLTVVTSACVIRYARSYGDVLLSTTAQMKK